MLWTPIFTAFNTSRYRRYSLLRPYCRRKIRISNLLALAPGRLAEDVLQGVEMGRSTACVAWAVVGIAAVIAVCALVGIAIIVACAAAVIVVAPIVAPVVAPVVGMVVSVAGVTGGFALAVMDAVLGTFGFTAALPGASFLGTFMCAELGAVVAGSLVALARSVVTGVVKLLGAVIDGSAGAAVAMKRFFAK